MQAKTVALFAMFLFTLGIFAIVLMTQTTQAEGSNFSDPAFQQIWESTDKAVSDGTSARPWLWGPQPFDARLEPYSESPNGERQVLYFDKARMEITNPTADRANLYYVTNGLLTVELVSGKMQTGDQTFLTLAPAQVPVAGDADDTTGPTYASFNSIASLNNDHTAANRTNEVVNEFINRAGQISTLAQPPTHTTFAYFSPELGHNIPDLFWKWLGGLNVPWQFATGLPISEPYWAQVKVGGQTKSILIQLFQRRVLTYTADNSPAFQVEMGNIGRHYWTWRYQSNPPTPMPTATATPSPTPPIFDVSISSDHPNVGSEVTITVKLLVNNKPAVGATVKAILQEKHKPKTCSAVVDQTGIATCVHKVTKSEKSFTVKVEVSAIYQGQTYNGTTQYQSK